MVELETKIQEVIIPILAPFVKTQNEIKQILETLKHNQEEISLDNKNFVYMISSFENKID